MEISPGSLTRVRTTRLACVVTLIPWAGIRSSCCHGTVELLDLMRRVIPAERHDGVASAIVVTARAK